MSISTQKSKKPRSRTLGSQLGKLPDTPGVYFFLGRRKKTQGPSLRLIIHSREVLYIGKAGSLRDRVRSYFSRDLAEARGDGIRQMVEVAEDIAYEKCESVLEAVLLEAELIKKYQPKYNVREKDDKSFNYVIITKEDFPRVLLVRGREFAFSDGKTLNHKSYILHLKFVFGPFPHGGTLRAALSIIRKIFPYRDKCKPVTERDPSLPKATYPQMSVDKSGQGLALRIPRGCFNRQIGLCPGVCTGEISKKEYAETIRNITFLFRGKKKSLLQELMRDMKAAAKARAFERAAKLRNTIFALKHIRDVSLLKRETSAEQRRTECGTTPVPEQSSVRGTAQIKRIESYDIAHVSGKEMVGVMTVVYRGEPEKNAYRKFKIKSVTGTNDTAALKEILERRFTHAEWPFPDLIVVDGGKAQMNVAEHILRESGLLTSVLGVVKDERHRPKNILGDSELRKKYENEILLANNEAHRFAIGYHREKMRRRK